MQPTDSLAARVMAAMTLLVLMGCTAMASAMSSPRDEVRALMRSETGRELEAYKASEGQQHAFKVRAVHTLHKTDAHIVHIRHPVAQTSMLATPAGEARGGSFQTEREKIRALWRLNMVAYTGPAMYAADAMDDIINNRDSVFGQNISSYEDEEAAAKDMIDEADYYLKRVGSEWFAEDGELGMDASGENSFGVHAVEWSKPGFGVVLCFRGTESLGDGLNILPWLVDWVNSRMTARMEAQWIELAGLDLDENITAIDDSAVQAGLAAEATEAHLLFNATMTGIAASHPLVDEAEVAKTGYWEFTKVIVDSVYQEHVNTSEPETLYITGHSQGGGRAALSSMYLEKKFNKTIETVTFAATGGGCFSRKLSLTGGTMLDDVNPYVVHEQVTDYVHPLDIYGHLGYDVGRQCTYGTTDIKYSRAAKYCKAAFQSTGPILISGIDPDLDRKFRQCRYFTHGRAGMNRDLMDDTLLLENGTTDGGCKPLEPVSQADQQAVCAPVVTALTQQSRPSFLARRGQLSAAAVIAPHF